MRTRAGRRIHPGIPRQVQHVHRAGRHECLRRAEAAPVHRPRPAEKAEDPHPRRFDERRRYRDIFEKYYPGQAEMVKDFWMPNKSWKGCDVQDPSARVLSNYGASGV